MTAPNNFVYVVDCTEVIEDFGVGIFVNVAFSIGYVAAELSVGRSCTVPKCVCAGSAYRLGKTLLEVSVSGLIVSVGFCKFCRNAVVIFRKFSLINAGVELFCFSYRIFNVGVNTVYVKFS